MKNLEMVSSHRGMVGGEKVTAGANLLFLPVDQLDTQCAQHLFFPFLISFSLLWRKE